MSVRKRTWKTKGGVREAFIVDYTDQSGARRMETYDKLGDARERAAEIKVNVRKGVHVAPSKSKTVAEAAEVWIKRVRANGRERGTLNQYRQHVDHHIVPLIGKVKLARLSVESVEDFRDSLLEKLSQPLARKVLSSFKSILRASNHVHVADNVRIEKDTRKRKLKAGVDIPTPEEVKRLIDASRPGRQRAMILIAVMCGLRASELRGLPWSDINLKAATLNVRQRADKWGVIGAPKSDSGTREIPLPAPAISELKVWKVACPPTEADLVFPTKNGRVENHAGLSRAFDVVMRRAHIVDKDGKAKYGVHSLRHFFASWCINRKPEGRELPAKEVQTLLGHSSIVMTMDIYGTLFPLGSSREEVDNAARMLLA